MPQHSSKQLRRRQNKPKGKPRNRQRRTSNHVQIMGDRTCPFPPRYHAFVRSEIFGYTASGAGTGDYSWFVFLNAPYLPFNTGDLSGLTPNGISYSTLHSLGFTQLCNAATYISYRVIRSTINVDIMPQSVTDSCTVTVGPTDSTSGVTVANSLGDRRVKTYVFGSGRTPPRGGISNSITQANFLGVRESAIRDDLSFKYCGNYNGNPANALYWSIQVETGDNAILGAALEVRIRLTYEVEFFNLTGMALSG